MYKKKKKSNFENMWKLFRLLQTQTQQTPRRRAKWQTVNERKKEKNKQTNKQTNKLTTHKYTVSHVCLKIF
jgi:hypothetical protein